MFLLLRARDHHRLHLKSFHVSRSLLLTTLSLGHFLEHLPCCFVRTRHLCSNDPYSDFPVPERQIAEPSRWKKVNATQWGITSDMIPPPPWQILKILRVRGFESYLVGGCVRDLLLNREPKDFDIITTANLGQVKKEFRRSIIIGQRFPICKVLIKGTSVEVSSFETVSRHAEEKERVIFSKMSNSCDKKDFILWRDSMHRDFTINSLFYDPFKNVIYDYSNGIADLKALKLRTLIPAKLSFQEDCARILRGIRIAGRLGLTISKEAATAMHDYSSSVSNLGKFRMMMEMNYMLSYGAANSTISLLQRFQLLDKILPFHAAYLDEQAKERSSTICMMMKLFSNLDRLFSCGRPCPPTLWVGLLAFHQALVANPQDGLAIWTFASVLYHGSWKKGVRFARENAKVHVAPEISGFCEGQSDEELAKQVTQMACLVQDSVHALMDAGPLSKYLSIFAVSPSSSTVFIPRTTGRKATELFGVLLNDAEVQKKKRLTFDLDYHLLVRGDVHETGFALGKVILETLGCESLEGMYVSRIEQEVAEEEVPRKKQVIIEEKFPQVPKEEQDIEGRESESLIKGQDFEKVLKEGQEIEANGSSKLSDFAKYLVTVKDGILASFRGQHANGDGEQEVVDKNGYTTMSQYGKSEVKIKANGSSKLSDFAQYLVTVKDGILASFRGQHANGDGEQEVVDKNGYTTMSQYGKSEVKIKDEQEIRKMMDVVKEDMETVEENMSIHCGMVMEDRKQTLVKMEDAGNQLQQEKHEDLTLQHEFSREKTDQFKAASSDKVIRKLGNKRTLVSDQGANLKKLKGQKLSKLETSEQETEVMEIVAVLKNASPKLAENEMQLSDLVFSTIRTEGIFSKKMKLLQREEHLPQPSIDDKVHPTAKADYHDSVRKSTWKIEKVKRKGIEILRTDDRTEQEEPVVALGSLSEKQQFQGRKPAKKVEKGKRGKLHDGKTVECATKVGKNSNKDDRVEKKKENLNNNDRVKKEKEKLNEDDRVKKEEKKDNHSLRQKVVRIKTEKPEGPNHYLLSFVEEEGDKRDNYSPQREDARSKIKNMKEEIDQPSSCNKDQPSSCCNKEEKKDSNKSLHEMFEEKRVLLKSALKEEKKAQVPLSKLFRR